MCPQCNNKLIPIHYGDVSHADIERVVIGILYIAEKYGIENFYCKTCKIKVKL